MYKLPVGSRDDGTDLIVSLRRLTFRVAINPQVETEDKLRLLNAYNSAACINNTTIAFELLEHVLRPFVPEGYELACREQGLGIWPIKAESPIITCAWPSWADYAAMDSGGSWYWYEGKPVASSGLWGWGKHITSFHPSEFPAFTGDWKESLVKNPNK
jgi:hypothetical protein